MTIGRMDRLRELRQLRRTVAEREAERARAAHTEFERRAAAAQEAHARSVQEAVTRRRAAIDTLMAEPSGPLGVARMANVHSMIDGEIEDAARGEREAHEVLSQAEVELAEKRDVLAVFLRRETAMNHAVERLDGERTRAEEDAEEEGDV